MENDDPNLIYEDESTAIYARKKKKTSGIPIGFSINYNDHERYALKHLPDRCLRIWVVLKAKMKKGNRVDDSHESIALECGISGMNHFRSHLKKMHEATLIQIRVDQRIHLNPEIVFMGKAETRTKLINKWSDTLDSGRDWVRSNDPEAVEYRRRQKQRKKN